VKINVMNNLYDVNTLRVLFLRACSTLIHGHTVHRCPPPPRRLSVGGHRCRSSLSVSYFGHRRSRIFDRRRSLLRTLSVCWCGRQLSPVSGRRPNRSRRCVASECCVPVAWPFEFRVVFPLSLTSVCRG